MPEKLKRSAAIVVSRDVRCIQLNRTRVVGDCGGVIAQLLVGKRSVAERFGVRIIQWPAPRPR